MTAVAAVLFTAQSLRYTADATRATRDQVALTARGQIADRFNRAIDQLGQTGNDKLHIRLGGIYSLEGIMRDSRGDRSRIIEILCSFIRASVPVDMEGRADTPDPYEVPAAPEDVRAAFAVLARRPDPYEEQNARLNFISAQLSLRRISVPRGVLANAFLHKAYLEYADFSGADLHGVHFGGADLRRATLRSANLSGARLQDAELAGADLREANLRGADLSSASLTVAHLAGADLRGADLTHADLAGANLSGADLTGANLRRSPPRERTPQDDPLRASLPGVDLHQADLRNANLRDVQNLTSEAVRCSWINEQTLLPIGVTRPPSGPPEDRTGC